MIFWCFVSFRSINYFFKSNLAKKKNQSHPTKRPFSYITPATICWQCIKGKETRYDYNLTIMKSPKPATDTIYPHIKIWWYRTMLNFYPPFLCRVLAAILKMADILKILKTQNCSSNGDLSLCQILCLYHYPVRSYQH